MVLYFFLPAATLQLIQLSKEIQARASFPSSTFYRGEKSDLLASAVSDDTVETAHSSFSFLPFRLTCIGHASVPASAFFNNRFEHFLWFDKICIKLCS